MKDPQSENNEMEEKDNQITDSGVNKKLNLRTLEDEIDFWKNYKNKYLFPEIVKRFSTLLLMTKTQLNSSPYKGNWTAEEFISLTVSNKPFGLLVFHDSFLGEIIGSLATYPDEILAGIENSLLGTTDHQLKSSEYLTGRLLGTTLKAISNSIFIDHKTAHAQFESAEIYFKRLYDNAKNKMSNLEALYSETLMLSEPAKLWKEKAQSYEKSGKRFLEGTIGGFIVAIVVLSFLILNVNKVYTSLDSQLTLKLIILITVLISFIGYGLHMLIKLTLSNFHLKTEAEHREQLTKLYLSLLQNEKINDIDRQIVFHSLFSNIDTGLIKSDNAPTTINPMSLFKSNQ